MIKPAIAYFSYTERCCTNLNMEKLTEFLKTTFNIDNNTSATLIVTLSVFILGFMITGLAKSVITYRYRKNYRKIFKGMINEIAYCTKKQSINFNKLIGTLRIDNEDYFRLKKQNINLLNNFNQIPFETFYSAYFKGIENICKRKKLTAFNKAFGYTDSLSKNESQYISELNNCIINFNKNTDKWNNSVENVRLTVENIRLSIDGKDVPRYVAKFFQTMDTIIFDWQKIENRSQYYIAYSKLITPMLNLYDKNEHHDIVKITKMLLDNLMDSEYHYQCMIKSLEFSRLLFSNFEYQYRCTNRILTNINKILN